MVLDPTLKIAIEKAASQGLLSDEVRQKLLAAGEKGLTPEQVAAALAALKKADEQYAAAKTAYDAKTKEINEKHLAELKRVVPKVMQKLEGKDREHDTQSAEQLFNRL